MEGCPPGFPILCGHNERQWVSGCVRVCFGGLSVLDISRIRGWRIRYISCIPPFRLFGFLSLFSVLVTKLTLFHPVKFSITGFNFSLSLQQGECWKLLLIPPIPETEKMELRVVLGNYLNLHLGFRLEYWKNHLSPRRTRRQTMEGGVILDQESPRTSESPFSSPLVWFLKFSLSLIYIFDESITT